MTRRGSNPRSTSRSAISVRTISPQPTSSTIASVISSDDERRLRAVAPPAAVRRRARVLERRAEVHARGRQRRQHAEQHAGAERDAGGEPHHVGIERDGRAVAAPGWESRRRPTRTIARSPATPAARPSTPPHDREQACSRSAVGGRRASAARRARPASRSRGAGAARAPAAASRRSRSRSAARTRPRPVSMRSAGFTSPTIASRSGTAQKSSHGPIESGNFCRERPARCSRAGRRRARR